MNKLKKQLEQYFNSIKDLQLNLGSKTARDKLVDDITEIISNSKNK